MGRCERQRKWPCGIRRRACARNPRGSCFRGGCLRYCPEFLRSRREKGARRNREGIPDSAGRHVNRLPAIVLFLAVMGTSYSSVEHVARGAGMLRAGDYNDRLPILPPSCSALFSLWRWRGCWATFACTGWRFRWTIALAVGAAAESTIVFLLLVCARRPSSPASFVGRGLHGGVLAGGTRRGAACGSRQRAGGSRERVPGGCGAGVLRGAVPDQRAGAGAGAGCP